MALASRGAVTAPQLTGITCPLAVVCTEIREPFRSAVRVSDRHTEVPAQGDTRLNIIMSTAAEEDTATNEIIEAGSEESEDSSFLIDTSSGFNPYDTATLYRRPHLTSKDGKS